MLALFAVYGTTGNGVLFLTSSVTTMPLPRLHLPPEDFECGLVAAAAAAVAAAAAAAADGNNEDDKIRGAEG